MSSSEHLNQSLDLDNDYVVIKEIQVDQGQEPVRIDKYLFNRLENTSRNRIQVAASASCIHVNAQPVKSNYKVKPGDSISVIIPEPPKRYDLKPENIPLEIVFEDDHVMVINKPAGLVVHPGVGNHEGTLVNGLLYHFSELPQRDEMDRPGIVHRLDKDTSGLMVIAKTEFALTHLAKQFFDKTITRRYAALISIRSPFLYNQAHFVRDWGFKIQLLTSIRMLKSQDFGM